MQVKYIRISDKSQSIARQLNNDLKCYIDVISGTVPFKERTSAKLLIKDIEAGKVTGVEVEEVSRLGRNLIDCLQTCEYMTSKGINIHIKNLGLYSLIDGKPNSTFTMVVSILANISRAELESLNERRKAGIEVAKANGVYKGRVKGSGMSDSDILHTHKDIVKHLKSNAKGKTQTSYRNIAKICNKSLATVVKVKGAFDRIDDVLNYDATIDPFAPAYALRLKDKA